MAAQGQASSRAQVQEITVVVSKDRRKRVSLMQLPNDQPVDKSGHLTLARENNLREYKSVYNIDAMPTEGAGSEFGREAKEEARRRKYGYIRKNYNPDAQPWLMTIGPEKAGKRLKGTRNGGILENASYFVFTKRPDGVFEAIPVEEWYNFKSLATYKNLNDEEAEELFARRDKTLNMFNIMVRKRINKDGVEEDETVDDKEKVKAQLKSKGLMLTEMEDWADLSDEDGPGGDEDSDSGISKKGKKGAKGKGKGKRKKDQDTDDEAMEDSDDGDMEAKQVDYMSDTSDSDSDTELREDKSKYEEKGVEDEDGLRDIAVESDNEKDNAEEEKEKEKEEGSSSSSESESDDPDQEDNDFTKAFLMTGSKKDRGRSPGPRSATPNEDRKRKLTSSPGGASPSTKKIKQEPTSLLKPSSSAPSLQADGRPQTPSTSMPSASRDGLTEDTVRRYLMRKPMSSKDLAKAFKSKKLGLSKEQIAIKIAEILKKIKTTQQKINGTVHFSISG